MNRSRFVRSAGWLCLIGAFMGVGVGVKEALFPTSFGTPQNVVMQGIVFISNALVLIGVIGLAYSGAAGKGRLATSGLGIAVLASALFLPLEVFVAVNEELGGALLGLTALLQGLGLALVGIAVLQAGYWDGWQRFTPLMCGLYTFLILFPVLLLSDGYNAWALAGWQLPFALLGLALSLQGSVRAAILATDGP